MGSDWIMDPILHSVEIFWDPTLGSTDMSGSHIVVKSRQFHMTVPFFMLLTFITLSSQCNYRLFYTLFYVKW